MKSLSEIWANLWEIYEDMVPDPYDVALLELSGSIMTELRDKEDSLDIKSVFSSCGGQSSSLETKKMFEAILSTDFSSFCNAMDRKPDLGAVLQINHSGLCGDYAVTAIHAVLLHRDLLADPKRQAAFLEILAQNGADFVSEQGAGLEMCTPIECAKLVGTSWRIRRKIGSFATVQKTDATQDSVTPGAPF